MLFDLETILSWLLILIQIIGISIILAMLLIFFVTLWYSTIYAIKSIKVRLERMKK